MPFDYWISVREIDPPVSGAIKFVAKIEVFKVGQGKVDHGLGETWGTTEDDARQKMQEKIDEWLGSQSA